MKRASFDLGHALAVIASMAAIMALYHRGVGNFIAAATGWNVTFTEAGWAFLLILALMIVNALFHAAEAALTGLRRSRVEDMKEANDPVAPRLEHLLTDVNTYFATCQVGSQLARVGMITAAVLASPPFAIIMSGNNPPGAMWMTLVILIMIGVVALVNLAFMELMFRGIARINPEKWGAQLYSFLRLMRIVLSPIVALVRAVSSWLVNRLGIGPLFSPAVITEEQLIEIVAATEESGELMEDEKEMIHSVIEFTDTVAREVMTPRTDIDAVDVNATPLDVAKKIRETGHTRIPIYSGTIDRIVGIVHAKDLLQSTLEGNGGSIRDIMREPYVIPESKDLHQLLSEFRSGRTQMAIVQDEFGGTAGLVTIEDLVEEIVGEIVDEYDVEEAEIQELEEGVWLIDGRTHVDDVNDEVGSKFESEEFDTIGGYVFGLFGRQPDRGEQIDAGQWELEVADTDGRRVLKVRVKRKPAVENRA